MFGMSEREESNIKTCESFRFLSLHSLEIFATALFADAANSKWIHPQVQSS